MRQGSKVRILIYSYMTFTLILLLYNITESVRRKNIYFIEYKLVEYYLIQIDKIQYMRCI